MTLALAAPVGRPNLQLGAVLILVMTIGMLANGGRIIDDDVERLFCVVRGVCALGSVPSERQFLFEAILPNAFGAALETIGLRGLALISAWIIAGYGLLAFVAVRAAQRGAITFSALALVAVISRIPELGYNWIGKPDVYLLAMLLGMAVEERGWKRNAFAFAAALCHPPIGVLSAAGLAMLEAETPRRFDGALVASAVVGYLVGKLLLRWEVLGFVGREAFALANIWAIEAQARPYALVFFAGSFSGFAGAALAGIVPLGSSADFSRAARALAALLVFWLFATYLSFDHTRIFSLLSAPLALAAMRAFRVETVSVGALSLISLIGFAAPQLDALGVAKCFN